MHRYILKCFKIELEKVYTMFGSTSFPLSGLSIVNYKELVILMHAWLTLIECFKSTKHGSGMV